jgi:hypothetical protein
MSSREMRVLAALLPAADAAWHVGIDVCGCVRRLLAARKVRVDGGRLELWWPRWGRWSVDEELDAMYRVAPVELTEAILVSGVAVSYGRP